MRFLVSLGMTKKECHCEATKLPWQSHIDYSQMQNAKIKMQTRMGPLRKMLDKIFIYYIF